VVVTFARWEVSRLFKIAHRRSGYLETIANDCFTAGQVLPDREKNIDFQMPWVKYSEWSMLFRKRDRDLEHGYYDSFERASLRLVRAMRRIKKLVKTFDSFRLWFHAKRAVHTVALTCGIKYPPTTRLRVKEYSPSLILSVVHATCNARHLPPRE